MIVIKHDLIPTKLPECCGKCHNRVGYMCMLRGKYVEDFDTSIIDPNCPLVEVFTKDEVITMLKEIREVAWKRHSKYDDDIDFEVDKTVDIVVGYIDEKINALGGGY